MGQRGVRRYACAAIATAAVAALIQCRAPTQVELRITTDIPCSDLRGVSITVGGAPRAIEASPADTITTSCSSGSIGSIFLAPGGNRDDTVAIRVIAGLGASPDDYVKDDRDRRFVVARRRLRFSPYETLIVPIALFTRCIATRCDALSTCVKQLACTGSDLAGKCPAGEPCATLEEGAPLASDAGLSADGRADADASKLDAATGPPVMSLAAGSSHTCAVMLDGTARCWGNNDAGRLGDGTTTERHVPTAVQNLSNANSMVAGGAMTCARRTDGTVACWGNNAFGQLGDGTMQAHSIPAPVSAFDQGGTLAAGQAHVCAIRGPGGAGAVQCWGDDSVGQIGDGTGGTGQTRTSPTVNTSLSGIGQLTTGALHGCALRSIDGVLACWGANQNGQLGDNTVNTRLSPVAVMGPMGAAEIAAGGAFTCIRSTTNLGCWGANDRGQLGDGTTTELHRPATAVPGITEPVQLALGAAHACARQRSGSVMCWGANDRGQLGNRSGNDAHFPVAVVGLNDAVDLKAGDSHTCALRAQGSVVCWGDNGRGQLGDGTTANRAVPTAVLGLP